MTMAQFSRDGILIYQGREEGIKAFILDKVAESIIIQKLRKHFWLDEKTVLQGIWKIKYGNFYEVQQEQYLK